jgi:hypothetical protein
MKIPILIFLTTFFWILDGRIDLFQVKGKWFAALLAGAKFKARAEEERNGAEVKSGPYFDTNPLPDCKGLGAMLQGAGLLWW